MLKKKYYTVIPRKPLRKKFGGGASTLYETQYLKCQSYVLGDKRTRNFYIKCQLTWLTFLERKLRSLIYIPAQENHPTYA